MSDLLSPWVAEKIGVEKLTREGLDAYQLKAIKALLNYVEKAPFYREHLKGTSVEFFDDFRKLPFLTEEMLSSRMVCISQEEIQRIVTLTTSGTTGAEKRLYFSKNDLEGTVDFFKNGLAQLVASGDCVFIGMPFKKADSVGDLIRRGVEGLGATIKGHGLIGDLESAYQDLLVSDSVIGTPLQVLALSRYGKRQLQEMKVKSVLVSADNAPQEVYDEIRENFQCDLYNHYGLTESGLGLAVECAFHQGMHPREGDIYLEVIDPETGEVLPDGCYGELVLTTLTREAMPLVRYRTGDVGRFLLGECECGTSLKRLDNIKKRLVEGEGFLTLKMLDAYFFTRFKDLIDYRLSREGEKVLLEMMFFNGCERIAVEEIRDYFKVNGYEATVRIEEGASYPKYYKGKRKIYKSLR